MNNAKMADLDQAKRSAAMAAISAKANAAKAAYYERQNASPDPAYADMEKFKPDPAYTPRPWYAPKKVNHWHPVSQRTKSYDGFDGHTFPGAKAPRNPDLNNGRER